MMDWSDRHCRFFFRLLAPRALVYTEMISTGAIIYGDAAKHLDFSIEEHPIAIQLGGSSPAELRKCALEATRWGFDEINLNCGCPSERVKRGNFGASLMLDAQLVADCVREMKIVTDVPVTVKHRLGVDTSDSYEFVSNFVDIVKKSGCTTFIVHARIALLKGLSPKENREIPPLNYEFVYRLKNDHQDCKFILNGGIDERSDIKSILEKVDGIMLGRSAYHHPEFLGEMSHAIHQSKTIDTDTLIERIHTYATEQVRNGERLRSVVRHLLGLFHGKQGSKKWRQMLSNPDLLKTENPDLILKAYENVVTELSPS